mmetsp:Transcript_10780/g.19661  ORF Transcript_10780/g.19661 Transcript_10780/m.19661 type:complete len:368 (-) Transcript_10780:154-1257(-)|eukprot:CAMPEP_0175057842 /NCGR_PEP_ID=MMETSP0052_2-20121109/11491_1 /TAXON_ID=51329 ORGANISM="Polytomella parva, Strain SAG 63-3" /NCGR_SAMPLE_ID=MMETSP0052_2 /ASSEMBLY_ACC=CAM_ASM_000194 /LENGTH=367 /DNA_ID=CAMNT_0016323105 /DNA_START=104 /DNA_END=1207 /DNA_ORIENTATION=+
MSDLGPSAYVGSRISLISKDIKYEGTLSKVDMDKLVIELTDVISYGTEGRREGGPQVPSSSYVIPTMSFQGSDIATLDILSKPDTEADVPAASVPAPKPAPESTTRSYWGDSPASKPTPVASPKKAWGNPKAINYSDAATRQVAPQVRVTPSMTGRSDGSRVMNYSGVAGGRGPTHAPGGRGPGFAGGRGSAPDAVKPMSYAATSSNVASSVLVPPVDFDFEEHNAKFKKDDLAQKVKNESKAAYNKTDFFDLISCEALEKTAVNSAEQARCRMADMRRLDLETFGVAMNYRPQYGGRGMAGRGGRGGAPQQQSYTNPSGGRGGAGRGSNVNTYQTGGRGGRGNSQQQQYQQSYRGGRGGRGGRGSR